MRVIPSPSGSLFFLSPDFSHAVKLMPKFDQELSRANQTLNNFQNQPILAHHHRVHNQATFSLTPFWLLIISESTIPITNHHHHCHNVFYPQDHHLGLGSPAQESCKNNQRSQHQERPKRP